MTQLLSASLEWMGRLAEIRDDTSGKHIERVQTCLRIFIEGIQQSSSEKSDIPGKAGSSGRIMPADWDVEAVILASVLHDIGKMKIPDSILLKKSRLTEVEFTEMEKHCLYGKDLIKDLQSRVAPQAFLEHAQNIAYYHHEKWDGTGYPEGLKGEEIPLEARMMAIVDVYDALVSERPYKPAYTHENALEIIQEGKNTHFDPALVDIFLSLSEKTKRAMG